MAPSRAIGLYGNRLRWHGGIAEIDRLIDLDPAVAGPGEREIVGVDAVRRLTSPVRADYDAGEGAWLAHRTYRWG